VLTYGEGLFVDSNPNPFLASEVARASNDWTIDRWLSEDDRLYGSILVSNQNPDLAAAEIRRLGGHPRMCQVLMAVNGLGPAFGHSVFDPIYEAASEYNLPLAIHVPGFYGNSQAAAAHGMVSFYFEYHVLITQTMQTHLVSFVSNGVFDRFPELRLVLVEGGVAWLPALMWRLDSDWTRLPRELRSSDKTPSEYFREHLRLTTQPLEEAPQKEDLRETLRAFNAEHLLLFSSDYPHWDTDQASTVARQLPKEWHRAIFLENAIELYGWSDQVQEDSMTAASAVTV
jgi:predicted TIM-barrel fold metal-dependent hydrolase